MKKKNGFSLIEILAIVVRVGIISGVAIWGIKNLTDKEEKATNNTLNKKIENAAHLYAAKYYASDIIDCSNPTSCFTFKLTDLTGDGLLKLSKDECHTEPNNIVTEVINVLKDGGKIKYNYKLISDISSVSDCFRCASDDDCKRE